MERSLIPPPWPNAAPFRGCASSPRLRGKEELDVRQSVGVLALVRPWWRAAPEGGVRHGTPDYVA